MQSHSIGMYQQRDEITAAIIEVANGRINQVYDKSKDTLPKEFVRTHMPLGIAEPAETWIRENGIKFYVDMAGGQKTGFFLDQRESRKLLMAYSQGKVVLNAFCYTGGFSLFAMAGKAKRVVSVDISQKALDNLKLNLEENGYPIEVDDIVKADALEFLQQMSSNEFDIIVLDPPAFAKSLDKRHKAVQAYKRINLLAMKKLRPNGLLFTFSCSQVVTDELFYHTMVSAGIESGRKAQVLYKLNQGPDHPVDLFHPEGRYLKGLVLKIT